MRPVHCARLYFGRGNLRGNVIGQLLATSSPLITLSPCGGVLICDPVRVVLRYAVYALRSSLVHPAWAIFQQTMVSYLTHFLTLVASSQYQVFGNSCDFPQGIPFHSRASAHSDYHDTLSELPRLSITPPACAVNVTRITVHLSCNRDAICGTSSCRVYQDERNVPVRWEYRERVSELP